jgi:hypothetical protein
MFNRHVMGVLAVSGGFLAVLIFLARSGIVFNPSNVAISAVLSISFAYGMALALRDAHRLAVERRALALATNDSKTSRVDGERLAAALPESITKSKLMEQSSQSLVPSEPAPPSEILTSPVILQYLAGAVMLLGLLGTFFGLLRALTAYPRLLSHNGSVYGYLTELIQGLNMAFGTTILGIAASLLLGLVGVGLRASERLLMLRVTILLAEHSSSGIDAVAYIVEQSLTRILPSVIKETAETLLQTSSHLEDSVRQLGSSSTAFQTAGNTMGDSAVLLKSSTDALAIALGELDTRLMSLEDDRQALNVNMRAFLERREEVINALQKVGGEFSGAFLEFRSILNTLAALFKDRCINNGMVSAKKGAEPSG